MRNVSVQSFTATRNACKLCTPLGACLAFRGVEGAVPFLHGSQGCSTYIRRYLISHFKEPIDIACSNFGEATAIFGGKENLRIGLATVNSQYRPRLIGIATTCLAETIGDDVEMFLYQIRESFEEGSLPTVVSVSTPSYAGSHSEGYHAAVRTLVNTLTAENSNTAMDGGGESGQQHVNLMPGMLSPADIRYLKEICREFSLPVHVLPDYSETLDGPVWSEYQQIPPGGAPLSHFRQAGMALASVELGCTWGKEETAGALLAARYGVIRHELPFPIGLRLTDNLFELLEELSGHAVARRHVQERGRLLDAMIDAHKSVFGKRAVVYGEPDLVVGIASLLAEIGVVPAICASGAATGHLSEALAKVVPQLAADMAVLEDHDFAEIEERAVDANIDLVIGNSKGFKLSRRLNVPLVRVGFPIHDRVGGPRLLHVGYQGTQQLFDRIANALIGAKQAASPTGYTYM
ncbi:MAG: nitrogenase component 1 [Planctomycetota bacterium]